MNAGTQKPQLRPLRLVYLNGERVNNLGANIEDLSTRTEQSTEETKAVKEQEGSIKTQDAVPGEIHTFLGSIPEIEIPLGEKGARYLLKRTPSNYLLNQVYGLWVFASLFILTLIMTRKVSVAQYGVYAIATSAFNTIAYIIAFGLEDATTTFVPRVLAEHGRAAAALLVRRLLALRLLILIVTVSIMLFTLPVLAILIAAIPVSGSAGIASGLQIGRAHV